MSSVALAGFPESPGSAGDPPCRRLQSPIGDPAGCFL